MVLICEDMMGCGIDISIGSESSWEWAASWGLREKQDRYLLPPEIVAITIGGAVAICVLSVLLQRAVRPATPAEINLQ